MIAGQAADLRNIMQNHKVSERALRKAAVLAEQLVASEPQTADEVEIQVEAVIEYCGLEHSEKTCHRLAKTALRNAVSFIRRNIAE